MSEEFQIVDAADRQRFETRVDGETAIVKYEIDGDRIRLIHTKVPEPLEGRGIGSALARHALDESRRRGLGVWPECPFIASYIRRHPEYLDVVADDFPGRSELTSRD